MPSRNPSTGVATVCSTARNPSRRTDSKELGIEILSLDVISASSIFICVPSATDITGGALDMLVNNSAGGYTVPEKLWRRLRANQVGTEFSAER